MSTPSPNTPTDDTKRRRPRNLVRLSLTLLTALLSIGSFTTIASAEVGPAADEFVQCIPTEFEPCPTEEPDPEEPVDPTPIGGPGDITTCLDITVNGDENCDGPDEPGNPVTPGGPGDITTCLDITVNGEENCDDDIIEPETYDNCRQAPVNPAFDTADATRASVYRLYCAYFLRYPDLAGFNFWHDTVESETMNLDEVSTFFAGSDEFDATYGELSNDEFVELIYTNVLERAAEPEGFAFWVGRLDSGVMTRGGVMLFFSQSDEFKTKTGTA